MSISRISDDLNIIQGLGDNPNVDNNLNADALKAKFDLAGNTLKTRINSIISEIETALSGKSDTSHTHLSEKITDSVATIDSTAHLAQSGAVKTYVDTAVTNMEVTTNKVTSISSSSTDTEYPSAKLVYDQLATKQATLDADQIRKITISSSSPSGGSDGDIWFLYS